MPRLGFELLTGEKTVVMDVAQMKDSVLFQQAEQMIKDRWKNKPQLLDPAETNGSYRPGGELYDPKFHTYAIVENGKVKAVFQSWDLEGVADKNSGKEFIFESYMAPGSKGPAEQLYAKVGRQVVVEAEESELRDKQELNFRMIPASVVPFLQPPLNGEAHPIGGLVLGVRGKDGNLITEMTGKEIFDLVVGIYSQVYGLTLDELRTNKDYAKVVEKLDAFLRNPDKKYLLDVPKVKFGQ